MPWGSAPPVGSRVWWQRRLGALVLLLRLADAGAVPLGLVFGLAALADMSVRLAAAAMADGFPKE